VFVIRNVNSESQYQIVEPKAVSDTAPVRPARAPTQVQAMGIARIVVGSSAGGMLATQAVLGVVGVTMLLAGKPDGLHAFMSVLPVTAGFAAVGWAAMRWLDNRITSLIQRIRSPQICLPLLEMLATGLPLGRIRSHLEECLCASLALVDEEWWDQNAWLMKIHAGRALDTATKAGAFRSLDGPWMPALLDAIERCGRTELLCKVERLQRGSNRAPLPPALTEKANHCAESLRGRIKRDNEATTLLRSAGASDNCLLRAVSGCEAVNVNLLLRPSAEGDRTPARVDTRTRPEAEETLQLHY
jgi:hypothetical protein